MNTMKKTLLTLSLSFVVLFSYALTDHVDFTMKEFVKKTLYVPDEIEISTQGDWVLVNYVTTENGLCTLLEANGTHPKLVRLVESNFKNYRILSDKAPGKEGFIKIKFVQE